MGLKNRTFVPTAGNEGAGGLLNMQGKLRVRGLLMVTSPQAFCRTHVTIQKREILLCV